MDLKITTTFALVALLNAMSPGPSLALIARSLSSYGVILATANIVGLTSGLILHGALLFLGFSELVLESSYLFTSIKLFGASYLCWLGSNTVLKALAGTDGFNAMEHQSKRTTYLIGYREGFMTSSLNPYTYLFYLGVFPQFLPDQINPESTLLILISIFVMVSVCWYFTVICLFEQLRHVIGSAKARRCIGAVSGITLILLGIFFLFTAM